MGECWEKKSRICMENFMNPIFVKIWIMASRLIGWEGWSDISENSNIPWNDTDSMWITKFLHKLIEKNPKYVN